MENGHFLSMAGPWARSGNLHTQPAAHTDKWAFVAAAAQTSGSHVPALSPDACAEENGPIDALPIAGDLPLEAKLTPMDIPESCETQERVIGP